MIVDKRIPLLVAAALLLGGSIGIAQSGSQKKDGGKKAPTTRKKISAVSYKKDVFPIIKMNCLPCHTEDEMNQSELYLDTYEGMMTGGKHGKAVDPGNADSSLIIRKLIPPPPFGDPMPMKRKTPIAADTINIIKQWILQGAKKN